MGEEYLGRAELLKPSEYLKAAHMMNDDGSPRDRTLTIDRVERGVEVVMQGGVKALRNIVFFRECAGKGPEGTDLKWILSAACNIKAIAALLGPRVGAWKGKRITLFAGEHAGAPAIRVRPTLPPQAEAQPQKED